MSCIQPTRCCQGNQARSIHGLVAVCWQLSWLMAESFRTVRMVEFHDTDMAGIMHFASFFVYMESAEHELIRSLGFSILTPFDNVLLSFPRVKASCEYLSPVKCEQELDIALTIARLGTKSITYNFQFQHEERQVAIGSMTSVCCRVQAHTPLVSIPIPAEISDKLKQYVV